MHAPHHHIFEAEICLYTGQTQWQYVLLPKEIAEKIDKNLPKAKKKLGTLRVEVKVEDTLWHTKMFDHKEFDAYLLPLGAGPKRKLRIGERISVDLVVLE